MIILSLWCSKAKNVFPFAKIPPNVPYRYLSECVLMTRLRCCLFAPLISPYQRTKGGLDLYLVLLAPSVEASLTIRPTPSSHKGWFWKPVCFPTSVNHSFPGFSKWLNNEQICKQSCKRQLTALIPWTFLEGTPPWWQGALDFISFHEGSDVTYRIRYCGEIAPALEHLWTSRKDNRTHDCSNTHLW